MLVRQPVVMQRTGLLPHPTGCFQTRNLGRFSGIRARAPTALRRASPGKEGATRSPKSWREYVEKQLDVAAQKEADAGRSEAAEHLKAVFKQYMNTLELQEASRSSSTPNASRASSTPKGKGGPGQPTFLTQQDVLPASSRRQQRPASPPPPPQRLPGQLGSQKGDPASPAKELLPPAKDVVPLVLLDTAAAYCAFVGAQEFGAAEQFWGQEVLVFLAYATAMYFGGTALAAGGVLFKVLTGRGEVTDYETYMESLEQKGLFSVDVFKAEEAAATPVQSAAAPVQSAKVTQALFALDGMLAMSLEAKPAGSTLDNLSAYITLSRAERDEKFDPSVVDLTESEAAALAGVFARYDSDDDGKLDLADMRKLVQQLDIDSSLSDDEVREMMAVLDENADGAVEFAHFVVWWALLRQEAEYNYPTATD